MSNVIQHKRKTTSGAPSASSMAVGEIVLVLPDKKAYIKNGDGTLSSFTMDSELNDGAYRGEWVGTQAQYDALGSYDSNIDYKITG